MAERQFYPALSLFLCVGLTACATGLSDPQMDPFKQDVECRTPDVILSEAFPNGAMAGCETVSNSAFQVTIQPEDSPINPSPWYAVRLDPVGSDPVNVVLTLDYGDARHRYAPKISTDGQTFTRLPDTAITLTEGQSKASLSVTVPEGGLYVAAQPIITVADMRDWENELIERYNLTRTIIGQSVEGRDIVMLETAASDTVGSLMIVGRQHPPEVTGLIAMQAFTEALFDQGALSEAFLNRYHIVLISTLNPDGVEDGHWRHNKGGLDLNRDWGPFSQPETQAALTAIDQMARETSTRPLVFFDFHSTRRNVFYTQEVGKDGTLNQLTARWLARANEDLSSDYAYTREGSHQPDLPTSKTYMHDRFGIPAITYEVGDNTNDALNRDSASIFARALMIEMLEDFDP